MKRKLLVFAAVCCGSIVVGGIAVELGVRTVYYQTHAPYALGISHFFENYVRRWVGYEEPPPQDDAALTLEQVGTLKRMFAAVQPVKLANCQLQRFGEAGDGGYLLCANLLGAVQVAYSYGINGFDGWGCEISRRLQVKVHQYDCFSTQAPLCPGGDAVFHAECVGAEPKIEDGRPFDTITSQIGTNGDQGKHIVVKMDVEGAEWESLLTAPETLFRQIDQFAIEFHHAHEPQYLEVIQRLSAFFYIANLHFNNFSCDPKLAPFPAWAYEILFVSKQLGILDPNGEPVTGLDPPNAPNNLFEPDCQAARTLLPRVGVFGSVTPYRGLVRTGRERSMTPMRRDLPEANPDRRGAQGDHRSTGRQRGLSARS